VVHMKVAAGKHASGDPHPRCRVAHRWFGGSFSSLLLFLCFCRGLLDSVKFVCERRTAQPPPLQRCV
jgi:hypothetical protein